MPYPFAAGEAMPSAYLNTALLKGGKNRIINGNFEINQRGYISGTNLASGSYGFDRWKSGFTNTSLTFVDGVQATTVTISSSGVLQQIIERENVPAGTYVLSWTGTATGRVYNSGGTAPAYAASPVTVTLNGAANVVVEFTASGGTRTLGTVQLEAGTVPSPFEYRLRGEELALCQRYFVRYVGDPTGYNSVIVPGVANPTTTVSRGTLVLPVPMRRGPVTADFSFAAGALQAWDGSILATVNSLVVYNVTGNLTTTISVEATLAAGLNLNRPASILTANGVTSGLSISTEL